MKEEILKIKITLEKEKEISDTLNISKQYQEIHIKAGFLSENIKIVGDGCSRQNIWVTNLKCWWQMSVFPTIIFCLSTNLDQVELAWTHFLEPSRPLSTSASKHLKILGILPSTLSTFIYQHKYSVANINLAYAA